ncbi:MAG: hypothetical protein WD005_04015, partial [Haliea sp.]
MPQKYPQRDPLKHSKIRYRVRNWNEYEAGQYSRGDQTLWFSANALRDWHPSVGVKPGGQRAAIETALTVSAVSGLVLRQIPPGRNAKTSDDSGIDSGQRGKNIQRIDRVGRRAWQRESGCTRRSLVETAVSRFKNEFG